MCTMAQSSKIEEALYYPTGITPSCHYVCERLTTEWKHMNPVHAGMYFNHIKTSPQAITSLLTITHLVLLFRWSSWSPVTLPALRRTTLLWMHRMSPSTCLYLPRLFNYISSIYERLRKVANRAYDILMAMYAERNDRNETESKPGISFDNSCRIVALPGVSRVLLR